MKFNKIKLVMLFALFLTACSEDTSTYQEPYQITYNIEDVSYVPVEEQVQILTPAEIFANHADAVFTIYTSFDDYHFGSNGSGFFIDSTGRAITNHHVIVGWPYAFIRTNDGEIFEIVGYYLYDLRSDLAIIQVEGSGFSYLTMGDSDSLRIGDSIYAIGSPLGYHNTFSTGIVSRFEEVAHFDIYTVYNMIQITAPISGGSSGGALLNNRGHVVGITTAGYGGAVAQALNFAVPISNVNLSDLPSTYSQLPVGEIIYTPAVDIVGTWDWVAGYYHFSADGTGSRTWDGVPDIFTWRLFGSVLVLDNLPNGVEQWAVIYIDSNQITVGGALFTRTAGTSSNVSTGSSSLESSIIGSWSWDQGWYVFHRDGSGSRNWNGDLTSFTWNLGNINSSGTTATINLDLPNVSNESWLVVAIDNNEISIGGAMFSRVTNFPAQSLTPELLLVGNWSWIGGSYQFNTDGTGNRNWLDYYPNFSWNVQANSVIFSVGDGTTENWSVIVINENEITIGGSTFTRY